MNKRTASGDLRRTAQNDGDILPVDVLFDILLMVRDRRCKRVCKFWYQVMGATFVGATVQCAAALSMDAVQRRLGVFSRVHTLCVSGIGFANLRCAEVFARAINGMRQLEHLELMPVVAGRYAFPFHLLDKVKALDILYPATFRQLARFEVRRVDGSLIVYVTTGTPMKADDDDLSDAEAVTDDEATSDVSSDTDEEALFNGLVSRSSAVIPEQPADFSFFPLQHIRRRPLHPNCGRLLQVLDTNACITGCYALLDTASLRRMPSLKQMCFQHDQVSNALLSALRPKVEVEVLTNMQLLGLAQQSQERLSPLAAGLRLLRRSAFLP